MTRSKYYYWYWGEVPCLAQIWFDVTLACEDAVKITAKVINGLSIFTFWGNFNASSWVHQFCINAHMLAVAKCKMFVCSVCFNQFPLQFCSFSAGRDSIANAGSFIIVWKFFNLGNLVLLVEWENRLIEKTAPKAELKRGGEVHFCSSLLNLIASMVSQSKRRAKSTNPISELAGWYNLNYFVNVLVENKKPLSLLWFVRSSFCHNLNIGQSNGGASYLQRDLHWWYLYWLAKGPKGKHASIPIPLHYH